MFEEINWGIKVIRKNKSVKKEYINLGIGERSYKNYKYIFWNKKFIVEVEKYIRYGRI